MPAAACGCTACSDSSKQTRTCHLHDIYSPHGMQAASHLQDVLLGAIVWLGPVQAADARKQTPLNTLDPVIICLPTPCLQSVFLTAGVPLGWGLLLLPTYNNLSPGPWSLVSVSDSYLQEILLGAVGAVRAAVTPSQEPLTAICRHRMLHPSGRPQVRKCTSVPFGALGGRVAEGLPVRGLKQVRDGGLAGKLRLEGSQEGGHGVAGFGLQLASLWGKGLSLCMLFLSLHVHQLALCRGI